MGGNCGRWAVGGGRWTIRRHVLAIASTTALLAISARAGGQSASGARDVSEHEGSARLGFMGVGVVTSASPAYVGRRITDAYLTQPNLMGDARYGPLSFAGTLDFEGYTLKRGELNAGIYGEGYIDRRHPHTLVHEAMLALVSPSMNGVRASIAAGKGFTPYGTDDPMMRPFVKYPVNHHHAQIIERAVVIGALSYGDPVNGRGGALEFGVFNGDEPSSPFVPPKISRLGDSRSARATLVPAAHVELAASHAFVKSPSFARGGAFDHRQSSASVRWSASDARRMLRYAMLEGARTDEGDDAGRVFRYESLLGEATLTRREWELSLRGESTERPENERLLDPFRTQSGHIDFQILGVTRWRIGTVAVASPALRVPGSRAARVSPFVEIARATAVARRRPTVFEPREFYGNATQWSLSVGARVHVGSMRSRMGRYGVLAEKPHPMTRHEGHH